MNRIRLKQHTHISTHLTSRKKKPSYTHTQTHIKAYTVPHWLGIVGRNLWGNLQDLLSKLHVALARALNVHICALPQCSNKILKHNTAGTQYSLRMRLTSSAKTPVRQQHPKVVKHFLICEHMNLHGGNTAKWAHNKVSKQKRFIYTK